MLTRKDRLAVIARVLSPTPIDIAAEEVKLLGLEPDAERRVISRLRKCQSQDEINHTLELVRMAVKAKTQLAVADMYATSE